MPQRQIKQIYHKLEKPSKAKNFKNKILLTSGHEDVDWFFQFLTTENVRKCSHFSIKMRVKNGLKFSDSGFLFNTCWLHRRDPHHRRPLFGKFHQDLQKRGGVQCNIVSGDVYKLFQITIWLHFINRFITIIIYIKILQAVSFL